MIVYHGTSGRAARDILRDLRVLVGVISRWGAKSRPMPRMYVTPDLEKALSYARSGQVSGDDPDDDNWAEGAVLKIDIQSSDVVPDEDWLGWWAPTQAYAVRYGHKDPAAQVDKLFLDLLDAAAPAVQTGIMELAEKFVTEDSYHEVRAPIGKKIISRLMRSQKGRDVLARLAARADAQAVAGTIKIVQAWTFDMHDYDGRVWQTPWEAAGVDLESSRESHLDQYGSALKVPDDVIPVMKARR